MSRKCCPETGEAMLANQLNPRGLWELWFTVRRPGTQVTTWLLLLVFEVGVSLMEPSLQTHRTLDAISKQIGCWMLSPSKQGQKWIKDTLLVSDGESGFWSESRQNHFGFLLSFYRGWPWKGQLPSLSHLTCEVETSIVTAIQSCSDN